MIDVDGDKPGRVNRLSLADLGDYRFGRPTRVTTLPLHRFMDRAGELDAGAAGSNSKGSFNSWLIDHGNRRELGKAQPARPELDEPFFHAATESLDRARVRILERIQLVRVAASAEEAVPVHELAVLRRDDQHVERGSDPFEPARELVDEPFVERPLERERPGRSTGRGGARAALSV